SCGKNSAHRLRSAAAGCSAGGLPGADAGRGDRAGARVQGQKGGAQEASPGICPVEGAQQAQNARLGTKLTCKAGGSAGSRRSNTLVTDTIWCLTSMG